MFYQCKVWKLALFKKQKITVIEDKSHTLRH
jgi:hypothetical protein